MILIYNIVGKNNGNVTMTMYQIHLNAQTTNLYDVTATNHKNQSLLCLTVQENLYINIE